MLTGCSWGEIAAKFTGVDAGDSVSFDADYSVEECVTLPEYKGIEVDCKVADDEIDSMISADLSSKAKENQIKEGQCKKGDTVNIDYTGKLDGKEFDGGTAQGQTITLGSSGYIPGFDDGVIGMKVGETKDLKLKFPDDYGKDELNGKDVVFTVTVNYLSETIVPELNEQFVTENTEYKTVDEYREGKRQELLKDKKAQAAQDAYGQVEEKATVNYYPESLVNKCKTQLDSYYRKYMAPQYGATDFSAFLSMMNMTEDTYNQSLKQAAEGIAKTQLVTGAIAKEEGIVVSNEEIQEEIATAVSQSGQSEEEIRKSFEDLYGTVITLEEYYWVTLLTNKVIDFVGENAKIVE